MRSGSGRTRKKAGTVSRKQHALLLALCEKTYIEVDDLTEEAEIDMRELAGLGLVAFVQHDGTNVVITMAGRVVVAQLAQASV